MRLIRLIRSSLIAPFLILAFALPVSASGALAGACSNLFESQNSEFINPSSLTVWSLLERPIPPRELAKLRIQWDKLASLRSVYDWNAMVRINPDNLNSENIKRAIKKVRDAQSTASTTLSGTSRIESRAAIESASGNWTTALEKINQWVQSDAEITLDRIEEINALFGHGQLFHGQKPGSLRSFDLVSDTEGGVVYMRHQDLELAMRKTMRWLRQADGKKHPVEIAAGLYQRLVSIHPFGDANGRTCRTVMEWYLQKHGYPPPVFTGDNNPYLAVFSSRAVNYSAEFAVEKTTRGLLSAYQIIDESLNRKERFSLEHSR